jgi:hypothetical protein
MYVCTSSRPRFTYLQIDDGMQVSRLVGRIYVTMVGGGRDDEDGDAATA